jgi:cytochrome b6
VWWRRLFQWVDSRLQIAGFVEFLRHKRVPVHRNFYWYYLGGITLFLFAIQVATGILLLLYYKPTAEAAFESVQYIVTKVPFGWLVRSTHSWAANLMIFTAFLHLFSVFFLKAYRTPRELTWVSGMVLLFLAMGFGFSGYLLPWNELAFFATKVGTDITGAVPLVGGFLKTFLRGGEDVTGATLTRFFGIHVAVLPMIFTVLLLAHLLMVQQQGMSNPFTAATAPQNSPPREMPFFPNFFLREAVLWVGSLAVLLFLSIYFPWELGVKVDPFAPAPAGIRPEWFFTFMSQALKYIPGTVLGMDGEVLGILGFGAGALFLVLVPFLDRWAAQGRRHPFFTWAGIAIIAFMLTMITLAYVKPY